MLPHASHKCSAERLRVHTAYAINASTLYMESVTAIESGGNFSFGFQFSLGYIQILFRSLGFAMEIVSTFSNLGAIVSMLSLVYY